MQRSIVAAALAAGFCGLALPAIAGQVTVITSFPKELTTAYQKAFEAAHLEEGAAVFEVHIQDLTMEKDEMNTSENRQPDDPVRTHQQAVKGFYHHALRYLLVITLLFIINWWTSPDYIWAKWPALGWGIGILSHGLRTFGPRAKPAPEAADH